MTQNMQRVLLGAVFAVVAMALLPSAAFAQTTAEDFANSLIGATLVQNFQIGNNALVQNAQFIVVIFWSLLVIALVTIVVVAYVFISRWIIASGGNTGVQQGRILDHQLKEFSGGRNPTITGPPK